MEAMSRAEAGVSEYTALLEEQEGHCEEVKLVTPPRRKEVCPTNTEKKRK
jgi:hypothetical protein